MFVRKKKNKSGVISVQVIDKSGGHYKVSKTIGSSSNTLEVDELYAKAKNWIRQTSLQYSLDFEQEDQLVQQVLGSIQSIQIAGIDLLLGEIFDDIGFGQINDKIFKQLVLYRLLYPVSKLKTTEYLYRFQQIDWDEDQMYRYLDKLYKIQKDLVQQISYAHTVKVLGNEPQIVFYDVTTIYFEAEREDDLHQTGFSKELERQLKEKKSTLSASRAIDIASFIFSITYQLPKSKQTLTMLLIKTEEQRLLADLFNWK